MYETWVSMLIVFITHPGVLFNDFMSSMPILRGFWQAAWATGLQGFSESSNSFLASIVFAGIAGGAIFMRFKPRTWTL